MAISLIDNLKIQNQKQNVERDSVKLISDFKGIDTRYLPPVFHAMCEEDGCIYLYNVNNDDDENLGKWKKLETSGSGGGTAEVPIEKIKVNGELQTPVNKVVDITVPEAYDDTGIRTELANKSDTDHTHTTVNGHTVESDVPVDAKFTDTVYDDTDIKTEIAKKADATSIPSKVSELENDSKYQTESEVNSIVTTEIAKVVADAPEDLNTLKEMSDWIAGHENDASAMNSAISDNKTNIETLQTDVSNINTSLDAKLEKTFTGADVANKILSTDEDGNVVLKNGGSGEGTAETTTYTNDDYPDYTNVDLALDALFAKVYYVKPTCSLSATPSGGTFEIGTTITAPITFTWTTNKAITSQTLTDCTLADASVRTAIYNTNVTSDKTFTLSVSDGENSASSSVSYKFLNKVYYGSASEPDSYDSAFILGLANNKFATYIKGSYPITVESGQFGYIACPKSFNAPAECYIGGFLTTLENAGEISFTNASGGVATYTILKTGKSGLGSLTMEFK